MSNVLIVEWMWIWICIRAPEELLMVSVDVDGDVIVEKKKRRLKAQILRGLSGILVEEDVVFLISAMHVCICT